MSFNFGSLFISSIRSMSSPHNVTRKFIQMSQSACLYILIDILIRDSNNVLKSFGQRKHGMTCLVYHTKQLDEL